MFFLFSWRTDDEPNLSDNMASSCVGYFESIETCKSVFKDGPDCVKDDDDRGEIAVARDGELILLEICTVDFSVLPLVFNWKKV